MHQCFQHRRHSGEIKTRIVERFTRLPCVYYIRLHICILQVSIVRLGVICSVIAQMDIIKKVPVLIKVKCI